jgi:hypothetical protein
MSRSQIASTLDRRRLLAGMAALLGLAVAGVSPAKADGLIVVRPPPLRYEPIPPPPGPPRAWIWIPGHWGWNRVRYFWVSGYYVRHVPSYHAWIPGRWVPRGGGWVWIEGHWR